MNPTSGKGRGGRLAPDAARRLRERGLPVTLLVGASAAQAQELAAQAVEEGFDVVAACGGDGTVHTVLQAVVGTPAALGIVPVGTGDDIARTLGIPLGDPAAAADVLVDGVRRRVDVAEVVCGDGTHRYFLGVLCSGFDSNVNERANALSWPTGQSRYYVAMLAELRSFQPVPYRVVLDGHELTGQGMLVSVGDGQYYGGGMRICPDADHADGLLDLTWLHEVGKGMLLKTFPKVYKGTHVDHPAVTTHRARTVRLEADGQVAYADGERLGPLPVDVTVATAGLDVLVPRDAPGAPRA